jgi:hypothetical protein
MAKHSINEAADGFTHSVRITFTELATTGYLVTGGAANQRIVGELPPGGYIDLAMLYQITDPAGATNLTIDFGTTSNDPDELLDNGDVDAATKVIVNTGDGFAKSTTGATLPIVGYVNNTTSALDLIMEFNGTHGDLTAGEWILAWRQANPPYVG